MSKYNHSADIAITPDGKLLALIQDTIIPFNTIGDFQEFLEGLSNKVKSYISEKEPLDKTLAERISQDAIDAIESKLKERITSETDNSSDIGHKAQEESSLINIVEAFFSESDWKFVLDGNTIHLIAESEHNGNLHCLLRAEDETEQMVLYSYAPLKVPYANRITMAEYLTRANYGLRLGNFEMDFSDGELRYKTSVDVEGGELTVRMVGIMVYANLNCMSKYLPGVMKVLQTEAPIANIIQEIET